VLGPEDHSADAVGRGPFQSDKGEVNEVSSGSQEAPEDALHCSRGDSLVGSRELPDRLLPLGRSESHQVSRVLVDPDDREPMQLELGLRLPDLGLQRDIRVVLLPALPSPREGANIPPKLRD
jgi:hypothetical protein